MVRTKILPSHIHQTVFVTTMSCSPQTGPTKIVCIDLSTFELPMKNMLFPIKLTCSDHREEHQVELQEYNSYYHHIDGCSMNAVTDMRWFIGKIDVVSIYCMF